MTQGYAGLADMIDTTSIAISGNDVCDREELLGLALDG